jgi:Sec-independent protein translocase protein TatA
VGFGTEILFMFMLGLVLLGPKRLHAMLGQVARVKAELDKATRGIKSQLSTELDDAQPASFPDEPVVPSKTLSGSRHRNSEPAL